MEVLVFMDLCDFIDGISTNYYVDLEDGNVVLMPYNNMQHRIIRGYDDGD